MTSSHHIIAAFCLVCLATAADKPCVYNGQAYALNRPFAQPGCQKRCHFVNKECKLQCTSLCPVFDELQCPSGQAIYSIPVAHYLDQKCFCDELQCKKNADDCTDAVKWCPLWASNGECAKFPIWLGKYCKKACNLC